MAQNDKHADPSPHDEAASGNDADGSSDLPEFLRTEPLPVIAAGQDDGPDQSDEDLEPADESLKEPGDAQEPDAIQRVSVKQHQEPKSTPSEDLAPTEVTEELGVTAKPDDAEEEPPEATDGRSDEEDPVVSEPKQGKRAAIIAGVSVAVLALAYGGLAWFFSDKVPADTTVAGVDVSHLDRANAEDTLARELDAVITTEVTVTLGGTESSIDPTESGLEFDIPATVDELVGFTLDPRRLMGHLFGVGAHDPVLHVNEAQVRSALGGITDALSVAPVEGDISITDGEIEITEPVDGVTIDVDEAVLTVAGEWLQGPRPIELPELAVAPTVDDDVIIQTQATLLDPLFSGDVPLTINEFSTTIPGEVVTKAASLRMVNNRFELTLDPEQITDAVAELLPDLGASPEPARIEIREKKVHIVPSVTGAGIDPEGLTEVVAAAAVEVGEKRHAELELETTESDFTTEDAEALKVTERVSHFSTPVPYDPVRTKNLVNGAKKITGILIKPGETFSLIEALGPMDAAHGYVSSGVVVNGFESEAMGGGLSQMSTTVFNAAFEAGMEDVTHQPHSRHFVRYPEGREATMFLPHLDMKWRNNTEYGVVVQSWIDDDAHVALWSTKYWDTKITTGPRTRFTSPQTVYNPAPNCVPESGGSSGFTVSVQRIVSRDGVRNDEYSRSYTHTYQPWNHVICGTKPKPPPPEKKSDSDESSDED